MSAFLRALGPMLIAVPLVITGCSSGTTTPSLPPSQDPLTSTSPATDAKSPATCTVLTTKQLREITGSTSWKVGAAGTDDSGALSCSWRSGDEGAAVTAMSARMWYAAAAIAPTSDLTLDDEAVQEWKTQVARHGKQVPSDQIACSAFDAVAARQEAAGSSEATPVITTADAHTSSASHCRDGKVVTVSLPSSTDTAVLHAVLRAVDADN